MNILVTAGPTREYIDPIRFISNASSGKQGIALAEQAKKIGHNVILIMGPCTAEHPKEVPIVRVTTAEEMLKSVLQYKDWMDVFIMNSAVGDYRILKESERKIKKTKKVINLKFVLNPDILAHIGRLKKNKKTKRNLILVGFSIDTDNLVSGAKKKLKEKNINFIVANPVDTLGSATTEAIILDKTGTVLKMPLMNKKDFAKKLIKVVCQGKAGPHISPSFVTKQCKSL